MAPRLYAKLCENKSANLIIGKAHMCTHYCHHMEILCNQTLEQLQPAKCNENRVSHEHDVLCLLGC